MSANPHFSELVPSLLKLTKEGNIEWEPTADENCYRTNLSGGLVTIRRFGSPLRGFGYRIDIANRVGIVVDGMSLPTEGIDDSIVVELFDLARDSALKTDQVWKDILGELNSRSSKR